MQHIYGDPSCQPFVGKRAPARQPTWPRGVRPTVGLVRAALAKWTGSAVPFVRLSPIIGESDRRLIDCQVAPCWRAVSAIDASQRTRRLVDQDRCLQQSDFFLDFCNL